MTPNALIDLIGELEKLKSAVCAVQADAAVAYDAAVAALRRQQGISARRQGRGVAAEIALARRESPHRGQTLLGLAKILRNEMPHTRARLADGTLSEFRAILLVRETACLSARAPGVRRRGAVCRPSRARRSRHPSAGGRAKKIAYEIDPASVVRRASNAESDRSVTVRPAPDTMAYLTGLLPVAQGVAVYATLGSVTRTRLRAQGDPRSRGQLMADLLVSRVTGADLVADAPTPVPVTVNLTMSDATLVGGHKPALVDADGVVPEMIPAEMADCCWHER